MWLFKPFVTKAALVSLGFGSACTLFLFASFWWHVAIGTSNALGSFSLFSVSGKTLGLLKEKIVLSDFRATICA